MRLTAIVAAVVIAVLPLSASARPGSFSRVGSSSRVFRSSPSHSSSRPTYHPPSHPSVRFSPVRSAPRPRIYTPMPAPRSSFYASHAPSVTHVSSGPPWWFWASLMRSNRTTPAEKTQLEADRREWTRKGECSRCHQTNDAGKAKVEGEW